MHLLRAIAEHARAHVLVIAAFVLIQSFYVLARLADVLDRVEPFASSAPQSLLVQLFLTTSEPQLKSRPSIASTRNGELLAELDCTVCGECDDDVLFDIVKEHVFCPKQECRDTNGIWSFRRTQE